MVIGDSGDGSGILRWFVAGLLELPSHPRFVVSLGDVLGYAGNEIEWAHFRELTAPLRTDEPPIGLFVVPGNHDTNDEPSLHLFREYSGNPGNGLFLRWDDAAFHGFALATSLPGSESSFTEEQDQWLRAELATTPPGGFRFLFTHVPPFPETRHSHTVLGGADRLHGIARAFGIAAVFSGHQHFYSHRVREGVHYIISGGGGSLAADTRGGSRYHFIQVFVAAEQACAQVIEIDRTLIADYCFPAGATAPLP